MANEIKKSLTDLIELYPQFITDWGINHPLTVNIRTLVVRFGRDIGKKAMTAAVRAAREGSLIDPNAQPIKSEATGEGEQPAAQALKRFVPGNYSKEPARTVPKKQIFRKMGTESEKPVAPAAEEVDTTKKVAAPVAQPAGQEVVKKKAATLKDKSSPQDTIEKNEQQAASKPAAAEGEEKNTDTSTDTGAATAAKAIVDTGDGEKDSLPLSTEEITHFKTLKPAAALHEYGEIRISLTLKALNIDVDPAWKGAQIAAALKQKLPK